LNQGYHIQAALYGGNDHRAFWQEVFRPDTTSYDGYTSIIKAVDFGYSSATFQPVFTAQYESYSQLLPLEHL